METLGRKATGLWTTVYDRRVAAKETNVVVRAGLPFFISSIEGCAHMDEYAFSEFVWNKANLITSTGKAYRLYHLLVEREDTERIDGSTPYLIKMALTQEILFRVTVHAADRDSFRSFQNAVFTSKL